MAALRALDRRPERIKVDRMTLFVMVSIAIVTGLHYLTGVHFLPYHTIYRSLYYLPIAVAAVAWGLRGGLLASLLISVLYLPHVWLAGETMPGGILDNLLEALIFNFVAALAGALADAQRRHRQHAAALRTYIDDVLASLPVGVATVDHTGAVQPQNPAGAELLQGQLDHQQLPATPGYAEVAFDDRPVGVYRSALHGPDGGTIGQVLVLEDLTEQRRLQQQVRQAEHLAALGQLAGGLAHEVRNPLGIVRATAQLLAAKLPRELGLRRHTQVLTDEADRIERLVGELLAYATPRQPYRTTFDAAGLVGDLTAALAGYAEQRGVRITAEVDGTVPPLVADREQLRQALLNLLLNALEASPVDTTVQLRCYPSVGRICFDVRDEGPGVPSAIRSRIFDPFFTTREEGVGMGLAVVARIVTDHDGTIRVTDAPGGGACFTLCLPDTLRVKEHAWPSGC